MGCDMVILTDAKIRALGTKGAGYSRRKLSLLGIAYPPKKGWKRKLIGMAIPVSQYRRLEELKYAESQIGRKRVRSRPKNGAKQTAPRQPGRKWDHTMIVEAFGGDRPNSKQCQIVNLPHPAPCGWLEWLEGQFISDRAYAAVLKFSRA